MSDNGEHSLEEVRLELRRKGRGSISMGQMGLKGWPRRRKEHREEACVQEELKDELEGQHSSERAWQGRGSGVEAGILRGVFQEHEEVV